MNDNEILQLRKEVAQLNLLIRKQNKPHTIRNIFLIAIFMFVGIQFLKGSGSSTKITTGPTTTTKQGLISTGKQPTDHYELADLIYKGQTHHMSNKAGLHGLAGWEGFDFASACDTPLYAPFDGKITYAGLDGYNHFDGVKTWPQATMVTLEGAMGTTTLLHMKMATQLGIQVKQGDLLGYESDIGWSYGCHLHLIWRPNTSYVPKVSPISKGAVDYYYGQLVQCSIGICKMSGYVPAQGGTNCSSDGDCAHTANGSYVPTLLASNQTYCAMPQEFPFDYVLTIGTGDSAFDCIKADNGGWILKVKPNQYDPACASALAKGNLTACNGETTNITGKTYYWIDVLN